MCLLCNIIILSKRLDFFCKELYFYFLFSLFFVGSSLVDGVMEDFFLRFLVKMLLRYFKICFNFSLYVWKGCVKFILNFCFLIDFNFLC